MVWDSKASFWHNSALGKPYVKADGSLTPEGLLLASACITMIVSALLYKTSRYFTPLFWRGYKALRTSDQRDWDTRYASMLHTTILVYYSWQVIVRSDLYYRPGVTPAILRTCQETCIALGVSLGFFIVDLVATVKYQMGGTEMILHHIGSFTSVAAAAMSGDAHIYTLWMLATEATTPFINLRWWLDKMGYKSSKLYLYNGLAIFLSWIVFRLALFPPFFYYLWHHRNEIQYVNYLSRFLLLVFPIVLLTLNLFWFMKIVQGGMKLLRNARASESGEEEQELIANVAAADKLRKEE